MSEILSNNEEEVIRFLARMAVIIYEREKKMTEIFIDEFSKALSQIEEERRSVNAK